MADFGPTPPSISPAYEVDTPDDMLYIYRNMSAVGGQVSWFDARRIRDDQVAEAVNIQTRRDGRRRRMPGQQVIVGPSDNVDYQTAYGMGYFEDGAQTHLICHWKDHLHDYDGTDWSADHGTMPEAHTMMCQGGANVSSTLYPTMFMTAVTGATRQNLYYLYQTAADTFTLANTNFGGNVTPRCAVWWQSRLWMGHAESVTWSDLNDGDTVTTYASQTAAMDTDIGDEIMALIPARGLEPYLIVFMKRRIYLFQVQVYGDGTIAVDLSYIKPITFETGTLASRTVKTLGPYVFFLAEDGVRTIMRAEDDVLATVREPISLPIQDVIDTITWSSADTSSAAVYGSKYYLSVPTGGATKPNTVLVFDLATQSWNVWNGAASGGVGAVSMCRGDISATPRLYFLRAQATTETAKNICHPYYYDDDHEYEGSATEVTTTEITKAITFGMPDNDKSFRFIELEYLNNSSTTGTLDIDARVDESGTESGWTDIGSITMASGAPTLPATLPFTLGSSTRTREKFSLSALGRGREIQFRFQETGAGEAHVLGWRAGAFIEPLEYD